MTDNTHLSGASRQNTDREKCVPDFSTTNFNSRKSYFCSILRNVSFSGQSRAIFHLHLFGEVFAVQSLNAPQTVEAGTVTCSVLPGLTDRLGVDSALC